MQKLPHAGTFEGDDVTHYGGLATFQSTYGTAKGSHTVTGDSIQCESDSTGTFVVRINPRSSISIYILSVFIELHLKSRGKLVCRVCVTDIPSACVHPVRAKASCNDWKASRHRRRTARRTADLSNTLPVLAGEWHSRWIWQFCRHRNSG